MTVQNEIRFLLTETINYITKKLLFVDSSEVKKESKQMTFAMYINNVIDKLPCYLKDAFKLHCEGCSDEEIAKKYNISLSTVRSRINLARKAIKYELEGS